MTKTNKLFVTRIEDYVSFTKVVRHVDNGRFAVRGAAGRKAQFPVVNLKVGNSITFFAFNGTSLRASIWSSAQRLGRQFEVTKVSDNCYKVLRVA